MEPVEITPDLEIKTTGDFKDRPCFYVSIRDGSRYAFVLGPFEHEADCRQWAYADAAQGGNKHKHWTLQTLAFKCDGRAHFCAWGMAKAPQGHKAGALNEYFTASGDTLNTFEI